MITDIYLTIDIGASSGRHILGWLEGNKIRLEEIHRFSNGMINQYGHLCWDMDALFAEILTGLDKCATLGKVPISVGVDTWGVDFVLLDRAGNRVGPDVAYRDRRTEGMDAEVYKCIPEAELYTRTGIAKQPFNTIYQLMAIKTQTPQYLELADRLLFIPDYLHYRLCGVRANEYTVASTSGLLNAASKTWDDEIIAQCGFPRGIFGEIVPAGTFLGGFTDDVKRAVGFDCKIILPPSHDTASAFLAVPARSDRSVYISSGTWSLMGVEQAEPITTEVSRVANFTNEGGYDYRFRYLKNIMGLWIIQSIRREIGENISFSEIEDLARTSDYPGIVDVNDGCFFAPESMVRAVDTACCAFGYPAPKFIGDTVKCVYNSLAASYARTVKELKELTGTRYDCINVIGGGSQNGFLNELTAKACGLPVYAGPTEGISVQLSDF